MGEEQHKESWRRVDGEPVPRELRKLMKWAKFEGVTRYGVPDRGPLEIIESAGDHMSHCMMLVHYFLPLVENEGGEQFAYRSVFDMVLVHDLADASKDYEHRVGKDKKNADIDKELLHAARMVEKLPRRDGFHLDMRDAYEQYLRQESREARFVRAINGLSAMLFIFSRCKYDDDNLDELGHPTPYADEEVHAVRRGLIAGHKYSLTDFHERIGVYCEEFPPMDKYYDTVVEWVFKSNKYFTDSDDSNEATYSPQERADKFMEYAGGIGGRAISDRHEDDALMSLSRLKNQRRWDESRKPITQYADSDGEHVAGLLILARYFYKSLDQQLYTASQRERMVEDSTLRKLATLALVHDDPEGIEGDQKGDQHTESKASDEARAMQEIVAHHAPRAGGVAERIGRIYKEYENDIKEKVMDGDGKVKIIDKRTPWPLPTTFMKALDVFEGFINVLGADVDVGRAQQVMYRPDSEKMQNMARFIRLFPFLERHIADVYRRTYPGNDLFD